MGGSGRRLRRKELREGQSGVREGIDEENFLKCEAALR